MNNLHRINFKATLRTLGVACVFMGGSFMMECTAHETGHSHTDHGTTSIQELAAHKNLPSYLINDKVSEKVTALEKMGQISAAIDVLKSLKDRTHATDEAHRLIYLKREFSVTPEEMLKKIQARIPDATQTDLEKWTASDDLFWIPVDGEIRYFRREPGILVRLNKDAKARADAHEGGDPAARSDKSFSFTKHIAEAVAAAKSSGSSLVLPVRYQVTHTLALKPGKVTGGNTVWCWLPYPREDVKQQTDVKLISMKPEGEIAPDAEAPQRTIFFEQTAAEDGGATFTVTYEYTSSAYVPDLTTARADLNETETKKLAYYLESRTPHLEQTDEVKKLSREIVGNKTAVVDKAFAIWSWLDESIPWCPEMEYAVITDIVDKVLTARRGDCGTQALTFIALARAAGVPARWQSGWVMKPGGWNLHDWAEFYAPGIGWVPVDPSVGRQESDDPAVRDFLFGHIDSYRMIANNDYGSEFVPGKVIETRSDPVDNQRGEVESGELIHYFDDWTYDVDVKIK